jgi:hypothetical protein
MTQVLIPDSGSHGAAVASHLRNTLSRYGVTVGVDGWTVDVRDLGAQAAADTAIAEGYALVSRSRVPAPPDAARTAWDAGIPYINGHGSNSLEEIDSPAFGAGYGLYVGGEDPSDSDAERSYGAGLEIDAITYDDSTAESYTTPTVAALLIWLYEARTDAARSKKERWLNARALLRSMADGYAEGWQEQGGYGILYGADPDGGDTYSAEAQAQVDRLPATAPLQPPMNCRATDKGDGEVLVKWLPYRSSAQAVTVIERGSEVVYRGDDRKSTIGHLPGAGETLTLRSEAADGTRSRVAGYATLDLSSYSYVPVEPPAPEVSRAGREVTLRVEPAPYDRQVDVSTSLGSVDGTRALPAGAEEVRHRLASEAQSSRYRVAVLSGDGSRLGAGPWTYAPGKQDLSQCQYSAEAFR